MFERFTGRARRVVVLAQDEARRLRHDRIGTEHIMFGLLREEDGVAFQALRAVGITLENVREQVEGIVGYGEDDAGSQAPFTPPAKKALERALRESLQLGHNYIGTEHLLLGLLREPEGVAMAALSNLNADLEALRREVMGRIGDGGQPLEGPGPSETTHEVSRRSSRRPSSEEEVFDSPRVTERARGILVLAQDEARRFNHNYIGTEHLLLGLLRDGDGIGAQALGALGVRLDEARGQVESIVGYGEESNDDRTPFTPRSKKVVQLAEREARQLGDRRLGDGHILLGLVRENEGVAARVLSDLGVDPDSVRHEALARLAVKEMERDPADGAERRIEEERVWTLFRGRVADIRTELNLPRPKTVTVDADYLYWASLGFASVEPGDVSELIRDELEETEARSLESVITTVGKRLLAAIREAKEVTVTISGVPKPADAPTFSVSATFER